MKYEMQWTSNCDSGGTGLRWLNQPEFYPICSRQEAYLMGHDLLEHFNMNDCSQEAEIFSTGAMARVRGDEYYHLINHPLLSGKSMDSLMGDGLADCLETMWDYAPLVDAPFFQHLGHADSYWQTQANKARIRNRSVEHALSDAAKAWEKSKLEQREDGEEFLPHQEYLLAHLEQAVNFARLGYAMACEKYRKYSVEKMAILYKSITKLMEKFLQEAQEGLVHDGMYFTLSTYPNEGVSRIKPWDTEMQQYWRDLTGHSYIQAHAFECVR